MAKHEGDIPQPTPWYRTKNGETLLSLVCCGVVAVGYYGTEYLSGLAAEAAGFVGLIGLLLVVLFSGRAAEKAAGEMFGGRSP